MNSETRRNVGELLAAQLDAIEADMSARSQPYRYAAELRDQRDSARRFAVDYEQRLAAAEAFVTERVDCHCLGPSFPYINCPRCRTLALLAGER